jgi:glycosyltransferase involved in cell wall biosynthesis
VSEVGSAIGGRAGEEVDVLFVQLGSTEGLRVADEQLVASLRRAGARVAVASAAHPGEVRTLMLTDLLWARAARRAAVEALGVLRARPQRAVIYSTTTAALLWPTPGAIRFDAPAAANRPGRHGLWQRPLERRRLRQAPLLLPSSEGAIAEATAAVPGCERRALVVPSPIAPAAGEHSPPDGERDIAAITYGANPHKKGLDRVLAAWRSVHQPGERLVVAGITPARLRELGCAAEEESIDVLGTLAQDDYHALLRRARVFICAPRREDYGLVQLEALAAGCQLVPPASPGPYVALPLAHRLDARLVGEHLGGALRAALDCPDDGYAARAAAMVEPFTVAAVDRLVARELLPRLLEGRR